MLRVGGTGGKHVNVGEELPDDANPAYPSQTIASEDCYLAKLDHPLFASLYGINHTPPA